jgi:hypothetical protein
MDELKKGEVGLCVFVWMLTVFGALG